MRRVLALAGAAAVLAVAGCGGSSNPNPPSGSIVVKMSEYKFDPDTISHASGTITFFLENTGTTGHDLTIYDSTGKQVAASDLVQPGNDSTFTVTITAPGSYPFKCTQPGHADAGMKGTLTVT